MREGSREHHDAPDCFARSAAVFQQAAMARDHAWTLLEWAHYELTCGDPARGQALWR